MLTFSVIWRQYNFKRSIILLLTLIFSLQPDVRTHTYDSHLLFISHSKIYINWLTWLSEYSRLSFSPLEKATCFYWFIQVYRSLTHEGKWSVRNRSQHEEYKVKIEEIYFIHNYTLAIYWDLCMHHENVICSS